MEARTYELMRELEDEHWWFVARRRVIEAVLRRLALPERADILEVGCGTGGNLAMLSRFGTVTGVERDEDAAAMARERGIAPVLEGELPCQIPGLNGQYDLIVLFDVIEHVDADGASLECLRTGLRPGGRIVLTVPAFNFLWSQHDVENHHKRRYRRTDLRGLATGAGLQAEYLSYFNFWLFPPVAAVRLVRKLFPASETWSDMRKPAPLVNALLRSVFGSEARLIGRLSFPFGSSVIAVLTSADGS